jgi:hypothetical protein
MVSDRYEHTFVGKKRADPRTKSPTATRDKRHGPRDIHFSLDGWFIVERYKPQLAMSMFVRYRHFAVIASRAATRQSPSVENVLIQISPYRQEIASLHF